MFTIVAGIFPAARTLDPVTPTCSFPAEVAFDSSTINTTDRMRTLLFATATTNDGTITTGLSALTTCAGMAFLDARNDTGDMNTVPDARFVVACDKS